MDADCSKVVTPRVTMITSIRADMAPWLHRMVKLAVLISLFTFWEVAARLHWYRAELVPPPNQVVRFLMELDDRRGFLDDITGSLSRVGVGFAISVVIGIALGTLFSYWKSIRPVLEMLLELLRPIPPVAWIPIAILWLGIGDRPAYFIVFIASFFPIFSGITEGIGNVDPHIVMVARSQGATRSILFRRVYLPSLLPFLFAGLKSGLGIAWMAVITAEMIGSQSGLGYRIQASRETLQSENIILSMIVIGLIGYWLNGLLALVFKRLMPWKASE